MKIWRIAGVIVCIVLLVSGVAWKYFATGKAINVSYQSLSDEQKHHILYDVYTQLREEDVEHQTASFELEGSEAVGVVLRRNGKFLGEGRVTFSGSLHDTLVAASSAVMEGVDEFDPYSDFQPHVYILGPGRFLDQQYIHGAHALTITAGDQRLLVRNTLPIERNYRPEKLQSRVCEQIERGPFCFQDYDLDIRYHEVVHFGLTRWSTDVVTWYRGKRLLADDFQSTYVLQSMTRAAEEWLLNNIKDDGSFTYVYNPSNGTYSENNNMIRQLMGSRLLAEMASENDRLLDVHQRNLDHIFSHRYQETDDGFGYVVYKNKSKLGAIAMLLRTLVYSPYRNEYRSEIEALFQTVLSLQEPSGAFHARYIAPDYEYDEDYLLTFYSGEAIVALIELFEFLGDHRALNAARVSQDFYVERYIEEREDWYYPAYVPWHTISLSKLFYITGEEIYAEGLLELNDILIDEMLHTTENEPYDILGRFYSPEYPEYGTPHSASDSVYLEGVIYALEIARTLGESEREQTYLEAIELGVRNLYQLQYHPEDTFFLQYPERVMGAIRYRADDNRIRIDTTQHTIDALHKLQKIGW